jgi:hypothetical protein
LCNYYIQLPPTKWSEFLINLHTNKNYAPEGNHISRTQEAIPILHHAFATLEQVAAVRVEVGDDALTKAIGAVKVTVKTPR